MKKLFLFMCLALSLCLACPIQIYTFAEDLITDGASASPSEEASPSGLSDETKDAALSPKSSEITNLIDQGSGTVTICWTDLGSAVDGYQLRSAKDFTFENDLKTVNFSQGNHADQTGFTPGERYYFGIRTYILSGSDIIYSPWSYTTYITLNPPAQPTPAVQSTVITSLTDGGSGNLVIHWRSAGSAVDGYQIRCAKNADFTEDVITGYYTGQNNATLTDLATDKTYYLSVRTFKIIGQSQVFSDWSGTKSITLTLRLPASYITSISSKRPGTATVKIKWVSDVDGYQIQYSTQSDYSMADYASVSQGTGTITRKNLKRNALYFFRVRTFKYTYDGSRYYSTWSSSKAVVVG